MPDGSFGTTIEPDKAETENVKAETSKKERGPREVSTIGFPYHTLSDAIEVARAILDKGAVPMARDQLAGAMDLQAGSGNFTNKIAATRMFGLIETVSGKYQLTRLGFDIVDSDSERAKSARAQAFLSVPLYRRTYDEFRNTKLPPRPYGLENAFVGFGVAAKQKDKARRAFDSSARLAGYFEHGSDKLVPPVIMLDNDKEPAGRKSDLGGDRTRTRTDERDGESSVDNHFIKGLLDELPMKVGGKWSHAERVKWLQLAAQCVDMLYTADDSDDGAIIRVTLVYNRPRRTKKAAQ